MSFAKRRAAYLAVKRLTGEEVNYSVPQIWRILKDGADVHDVGRDEILKIAQDDGLSTDLYNEAKGLDRAIGIPRHYVRASNMYDLLKELDFPVSVDQFREAAVRTGNPIW